MSLWILFMSQHLSPPSALLDHHESQVAWCAHSAHAVHQLGLVLRFIAMTICLCHGGICELSIRFFFCCSWPCLVLIFSEMQPADSSQPSVYTPLSFCHF